MNKKNTATSIRDRIPSMILVLLLLAIWQAAAMIIHKNNILPAPTAILQRIWELREALFLKHLPETLATILLGWGLAILVGVLLAAGMHLSRVIEAMVKPVLLVTQTIPVMCISPLFVIWLGYTIGARLIAVVLSCFFAIALNTYQGLKSVDQRKREWLKTCGAGRLAIFLHLEVPTALPYFLTSLKMTIPWAVVDAAVAEWLGATQGLGYFSKRMITKMDGAGVFAPLVILCALALLGMAALNLIDRKLVTWRAEM
ncbi:MAG: ABC transporter permease [Lachnospiraceae bacterium]|nr:ABC transporter permease [Lachnospiraceae bacterium]